MFSLFSIFNSKGTGQRTLSGCDSLRIGVRRRLFVVGLERTTNCRWWYLDFLCKATPSIEVENCVECESCPRMSSRNNRCCAFCRHASLNESAALAKYALTLG